MAKKVDRGNFTITLDLGPDVKASDLKAKLTDPNGKSLPANIEESKSKGKYVIKFSYEYDGEYVIIITGKGGEELVRQPINPYEITASQNPGMKSGGGGGSNPSRGGGGGGGKNNQPQGGGNGGGGQPSGAVISFEAPNSVKGAKASDFKAVITGPNGKRTEGTVSPDPSQGPGFFEVKFPLDSAGEHDLLVTGPKGIQVIKQRFDPAHGGFSGEIQDPEPVQSSTPSSFVVQMELPPGVKYSDLTGQVTDPKGKVHPATIEQDPKNKSGCVIKFKFTDQGDFHLVVKNKSGQVVVDQTINPSQAQRK